jgi:hypothetical protein
MRVDVDGAKRGLNVNRPAQLPIRESDLGSLQEAKRRKRKMRRP